MKTFYKEKWPRATRKLFISPSMKGKAIIKTCIKGNGRAQRGIVYKAFKKEMQL